MPEFRERVEPVHVVFAPFAELVKVPPTSNVVPEFWVKEVVVAMVKFPVVVAFPVIVQPPDAESRRRWEKGESPGVMVLPVLPAFIFTVPELWVKEAALVKFPPTAKTFDGAVSVPA